MDWFVGNLNQRWRWNIEKLKRWFFLNLLINTLNVEMEMGCSNITIPFASTWLTNGIVEIVRGWILIRFSGEN